MPGFVHGCGCGTGFNLYSVEILVVYLGPLPNGSFIVGICQMLSTIQVAHHTELFNSTDQWAKCQGLTAFDFCQKIASVCSFSVLWPNQ